MFEVLIVVYIGIATYYLIGIIDNYKCILETDSNLRHFVNKCKLALLFSCGLMLFIAYCWPILALSRLIFKRWIKDHLHPPIKTCPKYEVDNLF